MKILLTGARGDIGSILLKLFVKNGFSAEPLYSFEKNIYADTIIHLAAKSPPANYENLIQSNIFYLQETINFAEKNNIKNFIFFSAMSVYGNIDKENVNEKDSMVNPDFYGITKYMGEKIIEKSNVNALCIRFPAILGTKNKTNIISRIFLKLVNNEPLTVTNPDKIFNNFISVENIFNFLKDLKLRKKFDIINLASKKELKLIEIIDFLKKYVDSKSEIIISNKKNPFFNISTEKAENIYNFTPFSANYTLESWIKRINERIKI
jgi:nucleoside-diphosphate-sugar epimerase